MALCAKWLTKRPGNTKMLTHLVTKNILSLAGSSEANNDTKL